MTTGFPNVIMMSPAFLGILLAQIFVWDLEKQSCNMGATYIPEVRVPAEVVARLMPISGVHFPTHSI